MQKAVIMSRVSTDEQAKTGYSLDIQEKALNEYCKQHNIEIVYRIREDHSAKNFERPEYKKYLSFTRKNKNKIDFLFVTTWDRFSRNTTDSYEMIRKLKLFGVEVQAIQQPLDLSIPETKVLLAIYLTMPHVDNERRSIKVVEGMRAAKKAGRSSGRAPVGYKNSRDESNKPLLIKSKDSDLIKYAFEEFSKGLKTQVEILEELKKKSLAIRKNTFSRILRNTMYISKLYVPASQNEPESIVNGKHEAIVDEATFIKVQEILNTRKGQTKHPQYHTRKDELPLRGFLYCEICDHKMTGSGSRGRNGKRHFYYHCNKCSKSRHRADVVNDSLQDLLSAHTIKNEVQLLYKEIVKIVYTNSVDDLSNDLETAKQKIKSLDKKSIRLNDLLLDDNIKLEDYKQMKEKLKSEITKWESVIANSEHQEDDFETYLSKGLGVLKNLEDVYENCDLKAKQKLLGSTFGEKVIFDGKNCRTNKINDAVALILNVDQDLEDKKNGQADKNIDLSINVGYTGFEPVTPALSIEGSGQ